MTNTQSDAQAAPALEAPRHDDEAQTTWLQAARGKLIRVRFLEGKTLEGQLLAFDQGTLVLQGSGSAPLLVYKQSISYLAVDEPA